MISVNKIVWDNSSIWDNSSNNSFFDHIWNNVAFDNDGAVDSFRYITDDNVWFKVTKNIGEVVSNNMNAIHWSIEDEIDVSLR